MTKKEKSDSRSLRAEKIIPHFHIEADGRLQNISILISGCRGVSEFSEEKIVILTRREKIELCGTMLEMTVFEEKTVEISGNIEKIGFAVRERKREKK